MKHSRLAILGGLMLAAQALPAHANDTPKDPPPHWETSCKGPARAPDALVCTATENAYLAKTGQLLLQVEIISPSGRGVPLLQIQGPLGFYLPDGLKLSVDTKELASLKVTSCDQRGCFARMPLEPATLERILPGEKMGIEFSPVPGQRQTIGLPLKGFAEAMKAISY